MSENTTKLAKRPKGYVTFVVILMGIISQLDNYLALVESAVIREMAIDLYGLDPGISVIPTGILADLRGWIAIYGVIAFAVFFLSWFNDAFGRKKGLILLVLMLGIPSILLGFTPAGPQSFHLALLLYSIVTMATIANTWEIPVAEEAPPEKRGLLGALAFLFGLIPVYAFVADDIAANLGWKWSFGLVAGILMVVSLVMLLGWFKETNRWLKSKEERDHKLMDIKQAFKSMNKKDCIYMLILGMVYFIWSTSFKVATLGVEDFFAFRGMITEFDDYILTVGGLLTMFGALAAGLIMDKLGRNKALVIGVIGATISYVFLGLTASPVAMWGVYFSMPMVLAWITVYFAEIFPTKTRATCMGVVVTISRAAYVVGPALSAALLIAFPDWIGYWIVGGVLMLVPLLALLIKPFESKLKTIEEIENERDR